MTPFHALHRHRRPVARLALLAMLLLVLGPLVGQLSASQRDHHAGHASGGTAHGHHAGHHGASEMERHADHGMAMPAEARNAAPEARWHAACGYCTLFQQMPVLSAMLPSVPPLAAQAITAPVVATRAAHGGPAVFPQAPTRAPPPRRS
ncbi:DUF2946 domain-containing protein [Halomonas sp. THAF12]|uniref:DUF2946 domain-containing protein n=1 Tax=Halomonas sp. B23F22_10 TaxID=3459515 RepID=UPI00373EC653